MATNSSYNFPELLHLQRSWTLDEYHAMIRCGILGPDDRVELIQGKIIEMSPFGKPHYPPRCK